MSNECDKCHALEIVKPDPVNSPTHYQGNSMQAIDVIEAFDLNFCLGNAIKYILRAGKKGCKRTDLRKAIWYLNREMNKED
jgi:hypothetical protein